MTTTTATQPTAAPAAPVTLAVSFDAKPAAKLVKALQAIKLPKKYGWLPFGDAVKVTIHGTGVTLERTDLTTFARLHFQDVTEYRRDKLTFSAPVSIITPDKAGRIRWELTTDDAGRQSVTVAGVTYPTDPAPEDWPTFPELAPADYGHGKINPADVVYLQSLATADPMREVMQGVYFTGAGEMCASDGHKLAAIPGPIFPSFNDHKPGHGFILPPVAYLKPLAGCFSVEIRPRLASESGSAPKTYAQVTATQDGVTFADFFTRTITGTYPDFSGVIPTDPATITATFTADRAELAELAAKADAIFAGKYAHRKMTITPNAGAVLFGAENFDTEAKFSAFRHGVTWSGEPWQISFNPKYLAELIAGMPAGPVTFEIRSNSKPVICRCGSAVYLIMPIIIY